MASNLAKTQNWYSYNPTHLCVGLYEYHWDIGHKGQLMEFRPTNCPCTMNKLSDECCNYKYCQLKQWELF